MASLKASFCERRMAMNSWRICDFTLIAWDVSTVHVRMYPYDCWDACLYNFCDWFDFFIDNISMHVAQNCIGYDFLDGWAGPNGCFCAGSIPEIWKIWAWLSGHFTWLSTSPSQTSWIPNSICGGSPQGELKPVSAHCFGDSCGVGGHWVFSVQSEDSNPFR